MGKKILTLDIGASRVVLAEYEIAGKDALTLVNYGTAALAAPLDTGNAETILSPAIMEVVREKGIKPGPVSISISGQMVFPRFAAIPMAGGGEKFEQMVRYEIEQNIPFPIDEMVCDRQVLGDTENGDKSVMIVAAKLDQVEGITSAVSGCGFSPVRVDVAPIAATNAVRWASGDAASSVIILDVGAKTTSLIIAEGEKLFIRAIPIGGNNIDRDIGQALGITPEEARALKLQKGYVSQGGVTEDEDAEADRISKICRAVLTRLHAEISRSVNFSRSQQGFSAPTRIYLTGGTALLPQIDQFFSENLGIEVVIFNPFDRVGVGNGINADQLGTDAALMAGVTGTALHEIKAAALTVNLIPPSILAERAEKARIPVVVAGGALFIAALVCMYLGALHEADIVTRQQEVVQEKVEALSRLEKKVGAEQNSVTEARERADRLAEFLYRREKPVLEFKAFADALRDWMWIERWENGKVTIRGWKDRLEEFVHQDAARNGGQTRTASEIVLASLKGNRMVDPDSLKISDMTTVGAKGDVQQFTVEVKFK